MKLRSMIVSLRIVAAGINIHFVKGVLMGLLQSNPEKFGKYLNFHVSRSWVGSLYQRMKFSLWATTTSRPAIKVLLYNISDKLIINADQTSSKYVPTNGNKSGKTHFPIAQWETLFFLIAQWKTLEQWNWDHSPLWWRSSSV